MNFITYQNARDFVQRTRPTLEKDEVANGLILGITLGLENAPADKVFYLATVEDEEHTLLVAACMTPPRNIVLFSNNSRRDDEALAHLAQNLLDTNWSVPGALGTGQAAGKFAQIWSRRTGQSYKERMHQRIFELSQVILPERVEGALRVATEKDLKLITEWAVAFSQEAMHKDDSPDARQETEHRVRKQMIYVWELPDGRVVTMAGKTRPMSQVISISLVYTPSAYRGRGYASNCVAALSQHLLDEGWKKCSLVTDLANPTSNSIYQKIGYRPACDQTEYIFAARPAS